MLNLKGGIFIHKMFSTHLLLGELCSNEVKVIQCSLNHLVGLNTFCCRILLI